MYNIAILLEYNGSNYKGYQKQDSFPTVQGALELALYQFTQDHIATTTAGRTDAMVHALYQVVNFTTILERPLSAWIRATNSFLPKDIKIRDAKFVTNDFSARFSATARCYHYYIYNDRLPSAILHNLVGFSYEILDVELMQKGCDLLLGTHDFSSFRASNCQANSPIRTMTQATIEKKDKIIKLTFEANAFLYHMIRNIVGALIYLGCGRISLARFEEIFLSKNRAIAPPTFMPNGLYLANISYPNLEFNYEIKEWLF